MKDAKNVSPEKADAGFSRRRFLGYAAGLAGTAVLLDACRKEEDDVTVEPGATDLGTNDTGLLNLLFVTQQIEAALYIQIVDTPYYGMSEREMLLFKDIRDHEIAHREFLRNYLKNTGPVVQTDFSEIDFGLKSSVLKHAELIENLVIATMNEAGRLLTDGNHVGYCAKMVSVEARHAGTVSNMISMGAYFNTVDVSGAEQGTLPSNSITTFNRYLSTKVSGNNLPNK